MGRAENRRRERTERKLSRKEKMLVTRQELGQLKDDMYQAAYSALDSTCTEALIICFLLAGHRLYGLDGDQLLHMLETVQGMTDQIGDGTKTLDDLRRELDEETDISLTVVEE